MDAKAGICTYGNWAIDAIVAEYKQLDNKQAFRPQTVTQLTLQERSRALQSNTFDSM
jgi:hypothetical protein